MYANAPWDESGAESSVYYNWKILGFVGGTHGWGNGGGNAICDQRTLCVRGNQRRQREGASRRRVWPDKGHQWYGISRREIGDTRRVAAFQLVSDVPMSTRGDINGPAASTTLYALNASQNRIEVYDAASYFST